MTAILARKGIVRRGTGRTAWLLAVVFLPVALWLCGCGQPQGRGAAATTPAGGAALSIAAAADLQFALDDLAARYRDLHPRARLDIAYGSSGNFFAQLRNGAPFDLYFSADIEYPRRLAAEGRALGDDVFPYAIGRIVLWVPRASAVAVETLGLEALFAPSVGRIAMANPRHAPYGRAAVAALESLGVYERVAPRLVYGESIAQAAQFVQSGAADVGILALALALAPAMAEQGRYWEFPLDTYPALEQGGIVLRQTREPAAARAFRDFVLGGEGRAVLQRFGFLLPES